MAIAKYQAIKADLQNPVKKAVRSRKMADSASSFLRAVIITGLSFIILFPIFQQITLALRHPEDINNPLIIWIPEKFSLLNFTISIRLLSYWKALINNIKVSTIVMLLQIASTSLAGYAFARLKFKGSNVLFWILMITLIMPPQTTAVSRLLYFSNFDILGIIKLFNGGKTIMIRGAGKDGIFYLMAVTGQGIRASLFIYLFRQFFRGIPVELEESAQIDGASIFRTFWSVMLPNARGVMVTVGLFAFVWQWNDVFYSNLFSVDSANFPLLSPRLLNTAEWLNNLLKATGLSFLVGPDIRDNPLFTSLIANTSAFLIMLPLLIAYLFVQRLFVEGIERTGIVG